MKANRLGRSIIAVSLATVLLLALCGCHSHTVRQLVYTDDYPVLYAAELRQIFGDYTLGPRTDRHIEGEDCSCGYHQDTIDCWEWEISYTDALGIPMRRTLNNRQSLSEQQLGWMKDQISDHFYSQYMTRSFDGLMGAGSYCFCFVGRVCSSFSNAEEEHRVNTCTEYLRTLEKSEAPIPLSTLSYAELFDRYPMLISIDVKLADGSGQPAERYTEALGLLDQMTAEIAGEIGTNLNLHASVYQDVNHRQTVYYLRGQRTEAAKAFDFEHEVFLTYQGKFW